VTALPILIGVTGLEKLGLVIVPLTATLLAIALFMTIGKLTPEALANPGSGALSFGGAVSAVVGAYIVGIVIQPDYGRFVRRPIGAAVAAFSELGVVFPIILLMSAVPAAALGQPDLIAALIALGIGIPALLLLILGAWMEASACLYSGSLSLANLLPRLDLIHVIIGVGIFGAVLGLVHVERVFMPFLQLLSVALPPVAAVQCALALWPTRGTMSPLAGDVGPDFRWSAIVAWIVGFGMGLASEHGFAITGIAALDSIIGALCVTALFRLSAKAARGN
jgi:cytosine permease